MNEIKILHPFILENIPCDEFVFDFVHTILNEKWIAYSKRKLNLNLGFYKPQKKSKGILEVAEVVRFFKISKVSSIREIVLNTSENKKRLCPVRMSMNTAEHDLENNGVALIVPLSLRAEAKMAKIYWGSRYGAMMGHGSAEIWRKSTEGWHLSSTKGTWIS